MKRKISLGIKTNQHFVERLITKIMNNWRIKKIFFLLKVLSLVLEKEMIKIIPTKSKVQITLIQTQELFLGQCIIENFDLCVIKEMVKIVLTKSYVKIAFSNVCILHM